MKWTSRDWTSVIIGWICGFSAYFLVPAENPMKLLAVCLTGFFAAWIARSLISR